MYNNSAWLEINLDNLKHNIEIIRINSLNSPIMAAIKADAYGHGAENIAFALEELGIEYLAVATKDEALELRVDGIKSPILMFQPPFVEHIDELVKNEISLTLASPLNLDRIIRSAQKHNVKVKVHIKIDTGMGRIGFNFKDEKLYRFAKRISKEPHLILEGIYSHFSTMSTDDPEYMELQFRRFVEIIERIKKDNIRVKYCHISNSSAIISKPEYKLDMVRPGIMMYGLYPSEALKEYVKLKPVLSFKARIAFVKNIKEEIGISYAKTYKAKKGEVIATLPVGYADGLSRAFSNKINVLFRGKRVPVVGTICMDQCMINLTGFENVKTGEEVVIIGEQKKDSISIDDWAEKINTINYEIATSLSKRLPKIYVKDGKILKIKTYYKR